MLIINGEISLLGTNIDGEISLLGTNIDGEAGIVEVIERREHETYTGKTIITPSREEQKFLTAGMFVNTDLVVKPIPQNYGLITHDGFSLRIS